MRFKKKFKMVLYKFPDKMKAHWCTSMPKLSRIILFITYRDNKLNKYILVNSFKNANYLK